MRDLSFDFQCSVEEFLAEIDAFDSGIRLVLSDRAMPDTLNLDALLSEPKGHTALIANGARLAFSLPHRHETARLDVYFDEDVGPIVDRLRSAGRPT